MNCPQCNHPVKNHDRASGCGCLADAEVLTFCKCRLSEPQATAQAQRKAALDCLREYAELASGWRRISKKATDELIKLRARFLVDQNMRHISVLVRGYRKVGIL